MERTGKRAGVYRAGIYPVRNITRRNVLVKRVAIRAEKSQLRRQRMNAVLSEFCESIGMERSSMTWGNAARALLVILSAWLMACLMM